MWDHEGDRDPAKLRRKQVHTPVARTTARMGGDPELAALLFDRPQQLAHEFAELLDEYWRAAFAEEWERLEPRLAATVVDAGRTIARDGVYALIGSLSRRLRVDERREELGLDIPPHHRVSATEDNP